METSINENNLEMLAINKLLDFSFYIPSYQRGYRWTDKQVSSLLNDIWEFKNQNHNTDEYYCLQPIVIKEKTIEAESYWEIIDGQQRLTTILIILYYFNQNEFKTPRKAFSLTFATRPSSKLFLNNIEDEQLAKSNVDYFHIHEAYSVIKQWFEDKIKSSPTNPGKFYDTLVDSVNVIWYEINERVTLSVTDNPIDVFTRINMGKIPLTNSELIKALFLRKRNFTADQVYMQIKIAKEWDDIERRLQDDSFWYFIYNSKNPIKYENRIEYIFDLLKGKKKDDEEYHTFNEFVNAFDEIEGDTENKRTIEEIWLSIKNYYQCLEEWFNNSELYHLIGFLVEYNHDINALQKGKLGKSKIKYVDYLNEEIAKLFTNISIEDLDYKSHSSEIRKILLLFNIKTIISTQKAEVRFPFDKYKKEKWDIEHVNSQTDKKITKAYRKDWALDILEYFTGEKGFSDEIVGKETKTKKEIQIDRIEGLMEPKEVDYCNRLKAIIEEANIDEEFFRDLYDELIISFKENEFTQNDSISNLTLLDEGTNRSYKNAMFPIKRKHIIANDGKGIFVPICTKNLFLKYYSKQMGGVMYWKNSDAANYLDAIKDTLSIYLPESKAK